MGIESSGAYSPDKIYGQLTMPFINKPVHINAHTPIDEESDGMLLTKGSFYNNNARGMVSIEDIKDMKRLELDPALKVDIGIIELQDFPPKPGVQVFQASTYTKQSGVVFNALKNGYTGSDSIKIANAFSTYQNAAFNLGNNPVNTLIHTDFAVY